MENTRVNQEEKRILAEKQKIVNWYNNQLKISDIPSDIFYKGENPPIIKIEESKKVLFVATHAQFMYLRRRGDINNLKEKGFEVICCGTTGYFWPEFFGLELQKCCFILKEDFDISNIRIPFKIYTSGLIRNYDKVGGETNPIDLFLLEEIGKKWKIEIEFVKL